MLVSGIMETREIDLQRKNLFETAINTATKSGRALLGDNPALWLVFVGLALIDVLEFLALTGCHLEWLDG